MEKSQDDGVGSKLINRLKSFHIQTLSGIFPAKLISCFFGKLVATSLVLLPTLFSVVLLDELSDSRGVLEGRGREISLRYSTRSSGTLLTLPRITYLRSYLKREPRIGDWPGL